MFLWWLFFSAHHKVIKKNQKPAFFGRVGALYSQMETHTLLEWHFPGKTKANGAGILCKAGLGWSQAFSRCPHHHMALTLLWLQLLQHCNKFPTPLTVADTGLPDTQVQAAFACCTFYCPPSPINILLLVASKENWYVPWNDHMKHGFYKFWWSVIRYGDVKDAVAN